MAIPFTKMHGLGNDFVVIDQRDTDYGLSESLICAMSDRRTGIGFDQMLVIEHSSSGEADLHCRIFNADGSEVAQCGNGMRCVVRYAIEQGMVSGQKVRIATHERTMLGCWEGGETVQVDMGEPQFDPPLIPFNCAPSVSAPYRLPYEETSISFFVANLGNPHAVIQVDSLDANQIATLGPWLSQHPAFPEGVNVGFMRVCSENHIELQVYERGSGQTQACGSGACAAAVLALKAGLASHVVQVDQPGGSLQITWAGEGHHIEMIGPASVVFSGIYRCASH